MDFQRVLVSDTDKRFLEIADNKLKARGYSVRLSSSMKETLTALEEFSFDTLMIGFNKQEEKDVLEEYLETLDEKPVVIFLNTFSEYSRSLEM